MHHSSNITKSVKPYSQGCIWGTNTKCNNTTFLYLNHIPSPFHILGRNAQYLCNGERIVQCRKQLTSRWSPIHQTYLSLFSIVPFQAKGKKEIRGWRIEIDGQHLRPIFLLSRQIVLIALWIWVRFKRHHRTGIVATILFFQLSDTECTVIEPRQNPISSYIKLPLLAMFSLHSLKISC